MNETDIDSSGESEARCPCDTGAEFVKCCGRFLEEGMSPTTAVELMRSRFSAYRMGRVGYLVSTTHPDSRTSNLRAEIEETLERIEWISLDVLSTRQGLAGDKIGKVEFRAEYRMDGEGASHHEHSRFRRYEGHWKYLDDRG